MNRRAWPLGVVLLLAPVLAGCADAPAESEGSAVDGAVESEGYVFAAGKGAIAGLLVDDRFRPIQLTDDARTEFQSTGFILVQETGQQVQTDENGQFTILDLEPGAYTVRAQVEGHEATPQQVRVEPGVFNEINIVARRVVDAGSLILTQQFSGFIPCSINVPTQPLGINCFDTSQESYRPGPQFLQFMHLDDVTYLVAEAKASKVDAYKLEVFVSDNSSLGGPRFAVGYVFDSDYQKLIMQKSSDSVYDEAMNPNPWTNEEMVAVVNWHYGDDLTPLPDPGEQIVDEIDRVNVGFGIKTEFMVSVFLGEPEVDLEAYQVLR